MGPGVKYLSFRSFVLSDKMGRMANLIIDMVANRTLDQLL